MERHIHQIVDIDQLRFYMNYQNTTDCWSCYKVIDGDYYDSIGLTIQPRMICHIDIYVSYIVHLNICKVDW